MTKLILSTSNIMGTGPATSRRFTEKSNVEFISALRSNLESSRQKAHAAPGSNGTAHASWRSWTTTSDDTVYIPTRDTEHAGLSEEPSAYEITVKLFFLPNKPASCRCAQTKEAINLVLDELRVSHIDLLIISYPGIAFDADDSDGEGDGEGDGAGKAEDVDTMIKTWACLEEFHDRGVIRCLGVSEFGADRLDKFLRRARVRPGVDQINVRDCCVVPSDLILVAKREAVKLLTHNDCTNILPRGTLRELLRKGDGGFGVLSGEGDGEEKDKESQDGVTGDVEPQWVMKYTAVVTDRGVIENKGYFAMAEASGGRS